MLLQTLSLNEKQALFFRFYTTNPHEQ